MKTASQLWLEYADLHPENYAAYHGGCGCPSCEQFRSEANAWVKEQQEKAKGATA